MATVAVRREADDGTDVGRPAKSLRHFVAGSGPVIWLTLLSVHPETISAAAMKKPRAMNACDRRLAGQNHISTNYQINTNFQAQPALELTSSVVLSAARDARFAIAHSEHVVTGINTAYW